MAILADVLALLRAFNKLDYDEDENPRGLDGYGGLEANAEDLLGAMADAAELTADAASVVPGAAEAAIGAVQAAEAARDASVSAKGQAEAAAAVAVAAAYSMEPAELAGLPATLDLVMTGPAALPPGIFSRASAATYYDAAGVLRTAANNQPRMDHDPTTGALRGLRFEPASTNLLTNSADISAWPDPLGNTTVTTNTAVAPDGTASMDTLSSSATSGDRLRRRTLAVSNDGVARVFSIFAKAGAGNYLSVGLSYSGGTGKNSFVTFDLTTGIGTLGAGVNDGFGSQKLPGGIWRLWVRLLNNSTGNTTLLADLRPYQHPAVTASGSVYVWGGQVEVGFTPTSHIPTTSGPVERAADGASSTDLAWYNPVEGTLRVAAQVSTYTGVTPILQLDDGTSNNRITIDCSGFAVRLVVVTGGVTQATITLGSITINTRFVVAVRFKADDFAASLNGAAVVTDTSGTLPTVTTLQLGVSSVLIERVTGFGRAVANNIMQLLSAG